MTRLHHWGSFLLALLAAIPGPAFGGADPVEPFWSSYRVVEAPEAPPFEADLETEVLWRLDCGVDSGTVVGRIETAAPGPEGTVLLGDVQLVRILEVGPDGTVQRIAGRPGDGPGDLPGAYRVFGLADGRLGACEGAPAGAIQFGGTGRIVMIDREDQPAGFLLGAGEPGSLPVASVRELRCAAGRLLISSSGMKVGKDGAFRIQELAEIDPGGGDRTVLTGRTVPENMSDMTIDERSYFEPFASGRCDISGEGRVALAPERDQWLVVIRDPGGDGLVLHREWALRRRSKEEVQAVRQDLGGTEDCHALDTHPAVGRIRWRPDGRLWVEPPGVEPRPGAAACFDEFDAEGRLVRRIHLLVDGFTAGDRMVLMEDGRLALLRGFGNEAEAGDAGGPEPEVVLLAVRP
ncbi:MAG: hypothetical protein AB7V45_14020 [Candidatus Krumholzibacteriia bacterium]